MPFVGEVTPMPPSDSIDAESDETDVAPPMAKPAEPTKPSRWRGIASKLRFFWPILCLFQLSLMARWIVSTRSHVSSEETAFPTKLVPSNDNGAKQIIPGQPASDQQDA